MFQISKVTRPTLMAALALVWISTGAAMAQNTGTTTPAPQPVVIVDINSAPVAQLEGVVMTSHRRESTVRKQAAVADAQPGFA